MRLIIQNQLQLLVAITVALTFNAEAQVYPNAHRDSAVRQDESCETFIIERVARVPKIDSRRPKQLSIPMNQKLISPALSTLLKDVHMGNISAYRFKGPRRTALILRTMRVGSPLSEDSIQDWFIQIGQNAVRFKSFATNPNLIFWDEKGRLNYITLLWSDQVVKDASSRLVSIDFRRLRLLEGGVPELIEEEKNVRCILAVQKPR